MRRAGLVAIVYLVVAGVVNLAVLGGVGIARWRGHAPETDSAWPAIDHFRRVDERLWAGAVASAGKLRELRGMGFVTIVDIRKGTDADPIDDAGFVRSLGMEFVHLPVEDGKVPDVGTVRRLVAIVDGSEGPVYVHCGGGVGRSTTMEAAYRAVRGDDPSVLDQLAVGPPSLEQIWSVFRSSPERPVVRNPLVSAVSRVIDAPRKAINWVEDRV